VIYRVALSGGHELVTCTHEHWEWIGDGWLHCADCATVGMQTVIADFAFGWVAPTQKIVKQETAA
jgi:hypothetical protein